MGKPIAVAKGIAFAFPNICKVPAGTSMVPTPFPNVAQLKDANPVADTLKVGDDKVLLENSEVPTSTGGEAGSGGGVKSGKPPGGVCKIVQASKTVVFGPDKIGVVRFMDQTEQNDSNANGIILSSVPTVIVGD